jgi:hypothetical protein
VGTNNEVDCDLTYALTFPLIRSLVRSNGGKTPHRHPSRHHHPGDPAFAGSGAFFPTMSRSATTSSISTAMPTSSLSSSSDKPSDKTH